MVKGWVTSQDPESNRTHRCFYDSIPMRGFDLALAHRWSWAQYLASKPDCSLVLRQELFLVLLLASSRGHRD